MVKINLSIHLLSGDYWDIRRHPTGQHEHWAADGRKRLNYGNGEGTSLRGYF
jgi:hypothetical protein